MNKTVSINLGGFFFHIDEDAYQKLNRYFDAIKRSLSPDGKDEIMNDIESRIAELLSEKMKNDKQVVSNREIEDIIAVMGQPEDYRIDSDDEPAAKQPFTSAYPPNNSSSARTRKFYRDGEKAIVSGVCAGVSHYFRIDPLWIRILFVISLFLSFGASIFVYLLLWILIPEAITTTEKLEMTGEEINISNIERKVREEISSISARLQNVDYDRLGAQAKTGAERVGSGISYIVMGFFKILAKIVGAVLVIFSALTLGGIVVAFVATLFSSTLIDSRFHHIVNMGNYTGAPVWAIGLLGLFALGIPFFFLFLLGLKILVDNLRPIGSITKYTLLALWIITIAICIYLGVLQSERTAYEGKSVQKQQLALPVNDTLQLKFRYNDYFAKSINNDSDFRITQDAERNEVIYSNHVELYIMKAEGATPYVYIEKMANGSSVSDAATTAEKIKYFFELNGNTLILDDYLVTDSKNKYRDQKVQVYLYLPEGTIFKPDSSVKMFDNTDNNFFDLWFDGDNFSYRMEKENVKCLDCVVQDSAESIQNESKEAFQEYLKQKKEEDSIFTERNKKLNKN